MQNFNFLWVGSDPNMDKSIFLTLPLTLSSDPSIYNTKGVMSNDFSSQQCVDLTGNDQLSYYEKLSLSVMSVFPALSNS